MQDEHFLESLVGKTHLTDTDKRNLKGLRACRAAQQLNGHRFQFFPDGEKKDDDGKKKDDDNEQALTNDGKASVSKPTKLKGKKGSQKKNTKPCKTEIPLTQLSHSNEDDKMSDEDTES